MLEICLLLSIVIFAGFIVFALFSRKKRTKAMGIVVLGIVLASGVLVFPLFLEEDIVRAFLLSSFFAIKIPGMSTNFSMLENATEYYNWYKYLLYTYTFLAPVFAAGVVASFVESAVDELRTSCKTKKVVHVFSNANEKSLILAESIVSKNQKIIFCNIDNRKKYRERLKKMNAILSSKSLEDIHYEKYKEVNLYTISESDDCNLIDALKIIKKCKDYDNEIKVYVFSVTHEAQEILDSADKGHVKTMLINSNRQLVYNVLSKNPLYQHNDKRINVLVVGAGAIGYEFIKAVTWCGQMIDKELEIQIIDKRAKDIESQLVWQCSELKSPCYNIKFHQVDVTKEDTRGVLDTYGQQVNYIIISLGNDELNLQTAIQLRRYYCKLNKNPIIGLSMVNENKNSLIKELENEKKQKYDLYPFGSMRELYCLENIINNDLEERAKKVHLYYDKSDIRFERYYLNEYNRQSSLASALHLQYKLFSLIGNKTMNYDNIVELLKDKDTAEALAKNEHNRWMAYLRTEGYSVATIDDVKNYIVNTKNHVHHLAKLHPCLIDYDKLDELSKQMNDLSISYKLNKTYDFKQSDRDIVVNMAAILKEEMTSGKFK